MHTKMITHSDDAPQSQQRLIDGASLSGPTVLCARSGDVLTSSQVHEVQLANLYDRQKGKFTHKQPSGWNQQWLQTKAVSDFLSS